MQIEHVEVREGPEGRGDGAGETVVVEAKLGQEDKETNRGGNGPCEAREARWQVEELC